MPVPTLVNETRDLVLATQLESATNPWTRFKGLMLRRHLPEGHALRIEPCASIHMMFMLFAIDAVFYDKNGVVSKVSRAVPPWIGFSIGARGTRGVIELPKGAAGATEKGDRLRFD